MFVKGALIKILKQHPTAIVIKVRGGYMVFQKHADYETWRTEKTISVRKNPKKKRRTRKKISRRQQEIQRGRAILAAEDPYHPLLGRLGGKITKTGKRKRIGVRKNPGRYVICATIARHGKDWYFRRSTESFVDNIKDATKYQSASHAWSVAKSIKDQLPRAIKSIKVDEI